MGILFNYLRRPHLYFRDSCVLPISGLKEKRVSFIRFDEQWPLLYDADRLRHNTVPVVAAIYAEDMYVPPALSERTAAAISNLRPWITNEYEHSGLRDDERVFTRLVAMQRDVV